MFAWPGILPPFVLNSGYQPHESQIMADVQRIHGLCTGAVVAVAWDLTDLGDLIGHRDISNHKNLLVQSPLAEYTTRTTGALAGISGSNTSKAESPYAQPMGYEPVVMIPP